jgi:thioester reductase-like protein
MTRTSVFLTGATGAIGRRVLAYLLTCDSVDRAYVLVRDIRRWSAVARTLPNEGRAAIPIVGDLRLPRLGLGMMARGTLARDETVVIHLAATTSFSQSLVQARGTNTQGTANLLDLVALLPRVSRVAHVSTAFVAGQNMGDILERDNGADAGWVNAYEQSKYEAEALVRAIDREWTIIRPSTVVCDSSAGGISQLNAIHRALRLYHHGLASMMPGDESALVDVVLGDYVARGIAQLALADAAANRTFHLCAGDRALPLGELLDTTWTIWAEATPWKRRSVARPALTDLATYRLFETSVEEVGDLRLRQAVRALSHFVPQLALPKRFDTTGADELLGYRAPAVRDFWPRMVTDLLVTRWAARLRSAA